MNNNIQIYSKNIFPIFQYIINKKYRPIIFAYFQYLFNTKEIVNSPSLSNVSKLEKINTIEEVFFLQEKNFSTQFEYIYILREEMEKELIAPIIFLDTLRSFKKDASNFEYETWAQMVEYARCSTGTISRFLLSLYEENPSTYIPADSLSVALNILYNLANMKEYAQSLKRIYIPKDMLDEHLLKPAFLYDKEMSPSLKREILKKIEGTLKDAEILPSIIKNLSLRIQFCIILSTAHIILRKISYTDTFKNQVKISSFDRVNIILTGITEGFFTGYRSTSSKKGAK